MGGEHGENQTVTIDRDDLISLILVKWSLYHLIQCMKFLVKILENRVVCTDLEEFIFSDQTGIHCSPERELSFSSYFTETYQNAQLFITHYQRESEEIREGEDYKRAKHEFLLLLRGIFLIAFLFDTRIQRFIMTTHSIHKEKFLSYPPGERKANLYMDSIRPIVQQFLSGSLPLLQMSLQCTEIWTKEFMFQRHEEPSYLYTNNITNYKKEEGDIPHNDHQQIWWKLVHKDSDFSLTVEYLGF